MIFEETITRPVVAGETFVDLLRRRAEERPSEQVYTFLADGERESESLTYATLDREARAIARRLQHAGASGEPVLLVLPPGLQFISAFFGCLYAGSIATPAYPPASKKHAQRLWSIAADARPRVGLTTTSVMTSTRRTAGDLFTNKNINWLVVDNVDDDPFDSWQPEPVDDRTVALLQYTSGSVAAPKGVMITHANLLHNQSLIQHAFGQAEQSIIVSWLPVYHDMGLIGSVLQPLYAGAQCVLMSPLSFLQRPMRWLEAISRYQATTSGGPNFAFDLCARKVTSEQKYGLDLSSWSVAFNGAEPVLAETLDRFASAFADCGFRRTAFRPCYGLAEATLLVSAAGCDGPKIKDADTRALEQNEVNASSSPATTRRLTANGFPALGQTVVIVNPETLEACQSDQVGEIWITGPSVSGMYWNRPQETQERLRASLPNDAATYLRTGDMGFLDSDGLFVTGRLKDLIIVHGLNYHPHDIEISAQRTHTALRPNCGAAFSIENGSEQRIVLVQEIDRGATDIAETLFGEIQAAVVRDHELVLDAIALILPNSLPKTSSGKIRRAACREQFMAGDLRVVAQWNKPDGRTAAKVDDTRRGEGDTFTAVEARLAIVWCEVLEINAIGPRTNFFEAGGDSISAAQVIARAGKELSREISLEMLFDNPTIRQLAAALTQIEAKPGAQLQLRRLGQTEAELSYAQQRLWIDEQLRAGETVYNVPMALRITGAIDVDALKWSLNEIVRRHETLRTYFLTANGEPRQVIVDQLELDIPLVESPGLPVAEGLADMLRVEAARPFNLEEAPLVRALLVRLTEHQHVLLLTLHHLICDGWSAGVMLRELSAIYPAFAHGRPSPLEDLSIQYTDLAIHQREALQGDTLAMLLDYWRSELAGASHKLDLPSDHSRSSVNLHRGARFHFHLDQELSLRLTALGREEGSTLFMTLAAVFQILLARYSGQQQFLIGYPVANRDHADTHGLIGFLVNTLVLHCDLRDDPAFRTLLRRVRRAVLEGNAHQNLPFERLVEELQPAREAGTSPLFQVMLLLRQAEPVIQMAGLRLEPLQVETLTAMYDLTLELTESAGGLKGSFEYDVDLFEPETIARMADHFLNLVRAVVAEQHTPTSRLSLLSESERQRLLVEWNDTNCFYGRAACVHELVREQAERSPDAIAVSSDKGQISYRELQTRVDQLACWLQEQGVGPESYVGVCMTRSVEMVVALLGVMEAGAAYLPLDPSHPNERLAYMSENAGLHVILTEQALATKVTHADHILCLDSDWAEVAGGILTKNTSSTPDNVAYLIYTSGSTGQPKGVMNAHRGIVNRLQWMRVHYGLSADDRFVQKTPFTFDVSVWEFFAPLISGACLVMARPEGHRDPAYLAELIAAEQITIVHFVPAMLHPFLEQASPELCGSLRQVICSGEALSAELQERFFEVLSTPLDNLYGPTEAAVEVTAWRCRPELSPRVPIGRPIKNLRMYVLDRSFEPVPVGVIGELYIGGTGVARGYLKRPDLTAERFIPDPFSSDPGARLYQTGDLVRYRATGEIEFLGRADDQVKIRGYRIEPGEIAGMLSEHVAVRQAVVQARTDRGERCLVGYVVPAEGQAGDAVQLREYLRTRLPEYMVPAAFVFLAALPLNANGKVDSKALPEPEWQRSETTYSAPQTTTQELLAGIWGEVLEVERVGLEDNFFELGGHSLLATQVISRVHAQLKIKIPLRELFEAPALAAFAARVEQALGIGVVNDETVLVRADRSVDLPLSFAQQRLWLIDQLEPGSPAYNIHLPVRMRGRLDITALAWTLSTIVRRHEVLRTTFGFADGRPVQIIHPPAEVDIPLIDLTLLPQERREPEARRLSTEAARRSFDLADGPLLFVKLLRLSADEHLLLLTMHHIVSDGWSMRELVQEVKQLYAARSTGRNIVIPELPIQYADYAVWQRQYLSGEVLDNELLYWREQLRAAPEVLELPTDHRRPLARRFRGTVERTEFDAALCSRLKKLSRAGGVTLFMTLLSGFQSLLARYSGQEDFVVGSPIANRTQIQTEGLIGFFVNTLALRADLSGDPTVSELLARVREVTLQAQAHQEVPFERLVEELLVGRDLNLSPLFQVMFALQNVPMDELSLEGLTLSIDDCHTGTSRFDLYISLTETGDSITAVVEYDTDLFEPDTIKRMLRHYEALLSGIADDVDQRVSSIDLLVGDERTQVETWGRSDDARADVAAATVHELFERQAALNPDAVAVMFEDQSLTYSELNGKANRLAQTLRVHGATSETPIAVLMDRSFEMIVSLLAILKSGATYVPLDPNHPHERLAFILKDAGVKLLLTQSQWSTVTAALTTPILVVDVNESATAEENPGCVVHPENIAYITYTSGSTGQPKGVAVAHRGVVRLVSHTNYADFSSDSVFMLAAPLAFDASTFEIWGALLNGARLALLPLRQPSLEEFGFYVRKYGVTTLWLTAGLFHQMVNSCLDDLRGVRQLLAGGDVLSPEHVRRVLNELPHCTLINGYGPTENTTFTCCQAMRGGDEIRASVPIGRPISGTYVHVLDRHLGRVPVGVVGELYVGGTGVARGYLNRPDLTAERFIPDPFSSDPGARLYQTGDLVRYRATGEIEFLGRADDQVKIRGYRIEPGEIAGMLSEHVAVRQAVVQARTDRGERCLVGYVVPAEGQAGDAVQLREYLRTRLPEYMVPAAFVFLAALPLNANGKVDSKALPEPEWQRSETTYSAPQTTTQELLAGIWGEVLEVERVGLEDNFFELGGHSLLATQVISRVHAQLKIKIPLRELFEAPALAAFAARVESAIRQQTMPTALPAFGPISRGEELPLSFAQSRLWFLEQLEPGSSAYTIPAAASLKGSLNFKALQRALNDIVQRHEALRTRFISTNGKPVQVVDQNVSVDLETTDLGGISDNERDAAVSTFLKQATHGFDLEHGPLFRAHLLRLADDHHILIVTMHHIVSDGWSVGVFIRDLQHLYEAFAQDTPSTLPNLAVQYVDYAIWQREYLTGEVLDQHLSYWKERLADLSPLHLRAEEQRDSSSSAGAEIESLSLSEDLSAQLRTLSRREGVTLFMTLLAAFKLLLARRCGQEDIAIGTPIAGRLLPEWENLIGFFVNTLVMRTGLGGNPTFRELLGRIKETTLGAYAYQDLPFERLVEELQPDRSLNRHPFFDVLFNHVNVPLTRVQLRGLEIEVLDVNGGDSKFPLTVYTHDDNQRITVRIAYRQTLFSSEQIAVMLDQYREALSHMVQNLDDSISSFSLVTDRTRQLLPDPREEISKPHFAAITEMFNHHVGQSPENVAVTHASREWTYQELSTSANDIALTLLSFGLEPGQTVAVCGEKSFGLIAAILAASLSGGVLLTLDRKLPAARQRAMLELAKVKYVLYAGSVRQQDEWIFARSDIDSLTVDRQSGSVVAHNGQAFLRENSESENRSTIEQPSSTDAAYICFTSGTTGVPKGVLGSHQGLSHFISWQREEFGVGPGDRSAQLTGLSFDVVLRDIFLPLTSGATLCLPDDEEHVISGNVLEWLDRERVSILHTVPSLADSWLSLPNTAAVKSLRTVFFAGEPLTSRLIDRWRETVSSSCEVVNLYGPTETTLAKCFYRVPVDCLSGVQPAGKAIPHTQALILRDGGDLCGIDEIGEVVIRTPFRSLGYVNAPEEKHRWVENPFRAEAEDLFYHTGDKGRIRSDGTLELLGRFDDQVKIRGHRIEPGDIECVLRKHGEVRNAAVLVSSTANGEIQLVAYVALTKNSSLSSADLRSYLRTQLPEYMVPAGLTVLSALPLTPNGKIDRNALRDLEQPAHNTYEKPRDEIEELLAGIWSEVLKVELVGRDQNFFDLGGHSLIATQVISRAREIFHVDLPVRSLFSNPTIAGIAAEIRAARKADRTLNRPQLTRIARSPHLPLSFAQQRLWFIDQLEPRGSAYVIPAAVRLRGELNDAAVGAALTAIACRHENLRTRFINADGTPMQVIDEKPDFELRIVDLTTPVGGEDLELRTRGLLRDEATRGFDLSHEHLFRALLIRVSATEHILLITIHHIVSDAWSMGVLLDEFKAFYQSYDEDTQPALSELPVQYADYAAWQRDYLNGETQEQQLSYWRQQLQGAERLELPTDRPRPPIQTYRGAAEPFTLPAFLVNEVRHLGRREGCTLFMTLLAAFQILLAKSSGQKDVVVGTPITGRIHPDLEGLIGFFVNTLVMRASMNADPTAAEILQSVREAALGAFTNQDLPFDKLIEDLQPTRDPSRSPLFQVMFIFQHAGRKPEEFKRINVDPVELEATTAKFDLTLTVLGDSDELNCVIEYNIELFERGRILGLIRHFTRVLEAITANPDQSFSALSLLDHDERKRVLEDWNATEVTYSGEQNVATLFEQQAALTPDGVAFIEGDRRLTYGELNRRANSLARRLRQSGLRDELTAAVCMRRSPDMMVGLLAIIKAGGAYVPIDPQLPVERIAMMLRDSEVRIVLTEQSLSDRITEPNVEIICLDTECDDIETYDTSNLLRSAVADSALYLIYTSGSTGEPKGVIGTHRGAVNRFRWMWERFPFAAAEVTCLKTSLSFVDSVWECLGPLLAGIPGVMIPEATVSNTEALISQLAKENVTRIVLVPSLLESLVENHSQLGKVLPALRLWVCSGENLSQQLVDRFHAAIPDGTLVNLYGCSEVAADVTAHVAERALTARAVSIGRPVANTQVYILDEVMNPCGIGLTGQIYVGGSNLARGYWRRPDETADRFVPNPFATHAGERLYRTGDLGRYASSGEIEYVGRADHQFKVRGYRIESGEIESVLARHPNVRMAQVVASGASPSDKKLVAYVMLAEPAEETVRELHDYAARFLPSYMIPSAFVALERFPLLTSGKVDRRALPAAGREHTLSAGPAARASTPVEASLVEIWCEVLGLDQVGIYDNFFDLGGHSLALVKLRARIESRLGRRLSLPELFTFPSIAALGRHLQDVDGENDPLAQARTRATRQTSASRLRRQRSAELRLKQPAYQFINRADVTHHEL